MDVGLIRANNRRLAAVCVLLACAASGCSRHYYRRDADAQVAQILTQKDRCEPYALPAFSVYPDSRARFADPNCVDRPRMPNPVPTLNAYVIPPLQSGDPNAASTPEPATESQGDASGSQTEWEVIPQGPKERIDDNGVTGNEEGSELAPPIEVHGNAAENFDTVRPVVYVAGQQGDVPAPDELPGPSQELTLANAEEEVEADATDDDGAEAVQDDAPLPEATDVDAGGLRIVPIPEDAWQSIPAVCIPRMLEFESVRGEYERTFGEEVPAELTSPAPRLSLPNVMELALINSRNYQTQKEVLYLTALRLTLPRYNFSLNPVRSLNGTSINYAALNNNDVYRSDLGLPTEFSARQTTATAAQFLATFANDIALTFNGSNGFESQIGSELLMGFQQTVFQRDVQFENLTQSERQVVYASRNFIRSRRQLFRDLAGQYYRLLLSYREIEIASLDYFSNQRGYLQGLAEYEFRGGLPRVQVDQFEQNALRSRSNLVSVCNQLETQLDRLKLSVGLPPEMPLNLDLVELEALSAGDESTVARELISRARRELNSQRARGSSDTTALVNAATVLINRIDDIRRLGNAAASTGASAETGDDSVDDVDFGAGETVEGASSPRYEEVEAMLSVLDAKSRIDAIEAEIQSALGDQGELLELQKYRRTLELSDALLVLAERLIRYRQIVSAEAEVTDASIKVQTLLKNLGELNDEFIQLAPTATLERLSLFTGRAGEIRTQSEMLVTEVGQAVLPTARDAYRTLVEETVAKTLALADQAIVESNAGLDPVEVEEETAMLTALYTRLDLKNRRGELADLRREVKYSADDLKANLDLRARQRVRTPGTLNRPFSFSLDDSTTELGMALDTPLNRRAERNIYRASLIDYNAGLREIIDSEDNVKFEIRDDLRRLNLRRSQYEIGVKSAALAYERVFSTRLQLQLGTGNVVARDFLEAQQAYTEALSSVASQHINFILDRVELFYDMEAIRLDELGYWDGLLDEERQPQVDLDFYRNNPTPYGRLAPCLKYSEEIRHTVRPF